MKTTTKRPWVAIIGVSTEYAGLSLLGLGYGMTKKVAAKAAADSASSNLRDKGGDAWYGAMRLKDDVESGKTVLWGGYRLTINAYTEEQEAADIAADSVPWGIKDLRAEVTA